MLKVKIDWFCYDWYIIKNTIVHHLYILGYEFIFEDFYMCLIQYICYCLIYLMIMYLIKSYIDEDFPK